MAVLNAQTVSRLKGQLLTSGLQQKDQPLFQVINLLIDSLGAIGIEAQAAIGGGGGGGGLLNADYLTHENNQASLPNSRLLLPGSGVTIHKNGQSVIVGAAPIPWHDEGEEPEIVIPLPGIQGPRGLIGPIGMPGMDAICEFFEGIALPNGTQIYDSGLLSYTPVWDQLTTPPTLGDSTLTGSYRRIGSLVYFSISFTFGGTGVLGTGAFTFTLPFPFTLASSSTGIVSDTGTTGYLGLGILFSSNKLLVATDQNPQSFVTEASPFAWVAGDALSMVGIYFA